MGINFRNLLFGSRKRLLILVVFLLLLAVPLTVTLVGQQQDIRQRAETNTYVFYPSPTPFIGTGGGTDAVYYPSPTPYLTCTNKPIWCLVFGDFICNEPTGGWCTNTDTAPTPIPQQYCAQVLTWGRNLETRQCQQFSSSCLPSGWVSDPTCGVNIISPTPISIIDDNTNPTPGTGGTLCTQEARLCPDGSYVGRTGPDCAFAPCPSIPSPTVVSCVSCVVPSTNCHYEGGSCETCGRLVCIEPTVNISITPTQQCELHSRGDANCDGKPDTDDFNVWRDEFLSLVLSKNSDFNNDGKVDTDDFNIWRDSFLNLVQVTPTGIQCGGIAGIQCPSGYGCQLDGNYPDAQGTCVTLPPPPSNCDSRGTCSSTTGCPSGTFCAYPGANSADENLIQTGTCLPSGCPPPQ